MIPPMVEEHPVLIVGGGVVGLSVSLFLARHGVASVLVERHPTTSIFPRARGVNGRTMELFRELGLEERIRDAGSRLAPAIGIYRGATLAEVLEKNGHGGFIMRKMRARGMRGQATKKSPTGPCRCTQEDLEPILVDEARRLGVDVRFATELTRFEQNEAGVTATLRERDGAESTVRCRYLVAADGARGRVREQLGIAMSGDPLSGHQLNVYFAADLRALVRGREFSMCLLENDGVRGLLTSIDNDRAWVIHLSYDPGRGERPEDYPRERCVALIQRALGLGPIPIEIKHVSPWQSAVRIAASYRRGRVLLAGDAAHTMPPWGGFGANTGIQDAHNLAWKLAAVLSGVAGESLLSTYEVERMPVARAVAAISGSMNGARGLMDVGSTLGMLWSMRKVFPYLTMGYGYASRAVVLEQGPPPGPGSNDLEGRPGTRVPHLWMRRGAERISSLDLFGKEFVLLTSDKGGPWRQAAERVAKERGLPLKSVTVGRDVVDLDRPWTRAAGVKDDGACLVRPDGIVAFRSKSATPRAATLLHAALDQILA